jgi:hypothetical protein
MAHRHRWIDITWLGRLQERRLCMTCNEEQTRFMPALVSADGELIDAEWETVRQGVGQSPDRP